MTPRAFCEEACGDDPALFQQVRSYVEWEQRMDGFLSEPLYPAQGSWSIPSSPVNCWKIASGSFAKSHKAAWASSMRRCDEKLDRRIALKCAKVGFRKRLPPEVRNASDISHPNVCKIFEIHTASTEHGDFDFLTMEFLDGETLAERLRNGPSSDIGGSSRRAAALRRLAEAHRKHVIHGDLKSNNIILTEGGR